MGKSLVYKILESHLLKGALVVGEEIEVKVNQTLTQDSTGTMVYLQLEAMGVEAIKTDVSVAYIDHNMLQAGFENADDHAFIQSVARKYGIVFSKPGNGICHQLHLEHYAVPGNILIGSDSHTPTCGGMGMLAIGAGGLDVAMGMAKGSMYLKMPKVINVQLTGALQPWTSAKDIILNILGRLTVKGGVGAILEYSGESVSKLSVPERATIANMGAELGATTSIFPSDLRTLDFLKSQDREKAHRFITADVGAVYDAVMVVDLSILEPYAAIPHSPDNIVAVEDLGPLVIDQVAIGSCTNSSYQDLMKVAMILKGKSVHPLVSLVISPGSSGVLKLLAENGALSDMIGAGARILEVGCGPCIGMGQAPKSKAVSLRTFNRNFKGRCGTEDAEVYLVSPETAATSAVLGYLAHPKAMGPMAQIIEPLHYKKNESFWITKPADPLAKIEMGPNIKPFPECSPLPAVFQASVLLKAGNDITTDDIMPSGASLLPFRSNIPELSKHCFKTLVTDFRERALVAGGGIVVGGSNYGQGSSREHAALVPLYLGVKAVVAKSFARIHKANLVNAGIIPLTFSNPQDYDAVQEQENITFSDLAEGLKQRSFTLRIASNLKDIVVNFEGSDRDVEMLIAGGALNYAKANLFMID